MEFWYHCSLNSEALYVNNFAQHFRKLVFNYMMLDWMLELRFFQFVICLTIYTGEKSNMLP